MDRRHILIPQAETVHDAWTELLYQDIRTCEQRLQPLTIAGILEIEHEAVLAAIELRERGHLLAAGAGDCDDLGARLCEEQGRQWARKQRREIEDEAAFERPHVEGAPLRGANDSFFSKDLPGNAERFDAGGKAPVERDPDQPGTDFFLPASGAQRPP